MHEEFEPPGNLQDAIKCFWHDRKDFGPTQTSFEVIPDGYAEIIFHFGSCCISENGKLQQLPSPFMVGLLDKPAIFYTQNIFEVIAVRCYPWTVFDLLGLQSDKSSVHVFDHPITQLQPVLSKLIGAGKVDEAVTGLKNFFVNAHADIAVDRTLFKAGVAMTTANGTLPVSEVADAAHATVRTLERKFKQSSGRTVKDVSGLMRFEKVRNRLWTEPKSNLAGLAHDFGYTDQSHLSREFKRYSGMTPAVFAKKVVSHRTHRSEG